MYFLCLTVGFGMYGLRLSGEAQRERNLIAVKRQSALAEMIETERARYQLPHGMIEAVIDHETGGTWDPESYDPEVNSRCYLRARTDAERKACGSYGLMHTVCRLHWDSAHCDELTIPKIGLQRGAKKLGECWKKAKGNKHKAFALYNGTGPSAERYAQILIGKLRDWQG